MYCPSSKRQEEKRRNLVREIKRGECFKNETVSHCSNVMLAPYTLCLDFFKLMSVCVCVLSGFSHVRLCATPWTAAPHTRLLCPWGFSSQEYWSGLLCPSPGGLPNPGIKSTPLMSPAKRLKQERSL